jgi:hypothetical protein
MCIRFFKLIVTLLLAISFRNLNAQTSDSQLNHLLAKQDYWTLNEQYPLLKNQTSELLQLYTEALLFHYFNKPMQSNEIIGKLLANYSDYLPIENQLYLINKAASNAVNMQDYSAAASIYTQLIEQIEMDSLTMISYENIIKLYTSIGEVSPINVIYNKKQTKLKLEKNTVGLFTLPISAEKEKINSVNFIIDFGANYSMIEEKYMDVFKIKILSDSILFSNPYGFSQYGKFGVAEEIWLGNVLIKNVIFFISPNRIVDMSDTIIPENEINAILGIDVFQALGNLQISNSTFAISPSSKQKKQHANMLISESSLLVKAKTPKLSLTMHFDPGSNYSELTNVYLSKSQENLNNLFTDTISRGTWSMVDTIVRFKIPNFNCNIGGGKLYFSPMYLTMDDYLSHNSIPIDGVLGADIFSKCKKIIIDFNNMYFHIK